MSDPEGLRLLANHLAKVKLEAAEQIYALTNEGKYLKEKNEELSSQVLHLKQQCRENTLHWRLQERDDWKALLESVGVPFLVDPWVVARWEESCALPFAFDLAFT